MSFLKKLSNKGVTPEVISKNNEKINQFREEQETLHDRLRRNVYRGRDDFSIAQQQKTRSIERMNEHLQSFKNIRSRIPAVNRDRKNEYNRMNDAARQILNNYKKNITNYAKREQEFACANYNTKEECVGGYEENIQSNLHRCFWRPELHVKSDSLSSNMGMCLNVEKGSKEIFPEDYRRQKFIEKSRSSMVKKFLKHKSEENKINGNSNFKNNPAIERLKAKDYLDKRAQEEGIQKTNKNTGETKISESKMNGGKRKTHKRKRKHHTKKTRKGKKMRKTHKRKRKHHTKKTRKRKSKK